MRLRIRKKYLFYALAFSAAIISAINSGLDAIVSNLYISDPWALGLSIFLVGIPVSLFFALLLSIKHKDKSIGERFIDPSFKRIRLIKKEELKYQIFAAFGNGIFTVGYFALFAIINDPSVILPFSQVVILYLVVIESVNDKDVPTLAELQSIIIVTFGAILGSMSLSGNINIESLIIVFLIINPGWVILTVYQRKLKWMKINNRYNDSINIRVWNVMFSFILTAIMIFIYDQFTRSNHLMVGFQESIDHFVWVAIISTGAFFAIILYIRALGIGKASIAQAIRSSTIIFSIPVSILIAHLGIIEQFPLDPNLLIIKIIGISIMVLGIISFALTLVKSYIFIKVRPGISIEKTMDELWKIRGVSRVCAVTGEYDIVLKIHTRTLVKGYEKIIKKLGDFKAIKEYKWQSVLKEWEDI